MDNVFPIPWQQGFNAIGQFLDGKWQVEKNIGSLFGDSFSGSRIRIMGSLSSFSRRDLQMRTPLLRKEAALTTTRCGETLPSRDIAFFPLWAVSTWKPFFCKSVAKEGISAC